MFRRATTIGLGILFAVSALTATGCSKKFSCKGFANKVKKCKSAFTKVMIDQGLKQAGVDKLTDEQKKKVREQVKKTAEDQVDSMVKMFTSDEFIKECKKNKDSKDAKPLKTCMAKSSCEAFAKCMVEEAMKH